MFYIVFFLGLILALFKDKKNISGYLFMLGLILLALFRFGIGTDYFNYGYLYYMLRDSFYLELVNPLTPQEPLFRLIGVVFHQFDASYQVYLAFFSLINLVYIFKICKKYSLNPVLSLLIYFSFFYLTWTLSAIRQGLVLSVGTYYLLAYLENKRRIKFYSIVVILSCIHVSAWILPFFSFLVKLNPSKKILVQMSIVSFFIYFLPINILTNKIPIFFNVYASNTYEINSIGLSFIVRVMLLLFVLYFYEQLLISKVINKDILNLYIISMIFYFSFNFLGETVAARLAIFGRVIEMLIFSNLLFSYKKRIDKLIYTIVLVLLCLFSFNKEISTYIQQTNIQLESNYLPYISIFGDDRYSYFYSKNYHHFERAKFIR